MPNDQDFEAMLKDCLRGLSSGEDHTRTRILEICDTRLHELSHRLLGKFAKVRRWDDTDDVAQNAAMRLYRALAESVPDSPRGLMGLMATQIQRELLDLARKHSGPTSYAANHGTNCCRVNDQPVFFVEHAPAPNDDDDELPIDRWEQFHAAVDALPEEEREVFRLAWYLGLEQRPIAQAIGVSERTVARRWRMGRDLLLQILKSNDWQSCGQ